MDARDGKVHLQLAHNRQLGHLAAPEKYGELYKSLISLGLTPVGVEFVYGTANGGLAPPDWECAAPQGGFMALSEGLAWDNIRTAALSDGNRLVADIASRSKTYLQLLSIRILQLSDAYNQTIRAARDARPGHFFSNRFLPFIDAALHAFVADAACFRDVIVETVWRLVLKEDASVTTLATFLRKAKTNPHPCATAIVAMGQPGGWLKTFSDLRNEVTHVAPVGRSQTFHMCYARAMPCGDGQITLLHYPLLAEDGSVRRSGEDEFLDFKDEAKVKSRIEEYRA